MSKKIIEQARERYELSVETESEVRKSMLDDIRFDSGDQWPESVKRLRENDPDGARPCLTVNMTRKHKLALLNEIRRNRPAIKVLPVDDKADIETAEILNGLLRHIQSVSDADIATDTAADCQITAGVGYFRIDTDLIDEARNEQEVTFRAIPNLFSVRMDCYADHPAGADAEWCFIEEEISRDKFKILYPDSEAADWEGDDDLDWYPDEDTIRVAEYFCIKEDKSNVLSTKEGDYDETEYWQHHAGKADRPKVNNASWSKSRRCHWYKIAGNEILEERELPTSYIPVIRVVGEERRYDGHRDFRGVVRDLKDPQRMYNYWTSANTEVIALAPKAPYLAAAEAIENHEDEWAEANTANKPYLPYNQFSEHGERLDQPSRASHAQVNTAIVQSMMQAAEDMRQVSGQSQTSFGEQGNEKSGKAINARRAEQDTNTFHFVDNLARSMKHAGRIVIEMIPHIYDTKRVVRILGEDDTPDFATFDPSITRASMEMSDVAGTIERIYNPSIGRYDVRVTVGPSYATKAEEGADRLAQIIQSAPDLMAIAGDLLFKSMDIPGSEELSERMKAMLPPELQQLAESKASGQEQGFQQAEMVRQQMMEQMTPMIEELKGALGEAAQENDALQGQVEQLNAQLEDKQSEMMLKKYEIDKKTETEMADAEAEVAVAYIQAQSAPDAPEPAAEPDVASAHTMAALASQQTVQMVTAMQETLQEQVAQVMQVAEGAMQGVQSMQQVNNTQDEQLTALAEHMEAADARREHFRQVASGLLSGKLSDAQAAAALGQIN